MQRHTTTGKARAYQGSEHRREPAIPSPLLLADKNAEKLPQARSISAEFSDFFFKSLLRKRAFSASRQAGRACGPCFGVKRTSCEKSSSNVREEEDLEVSQCAANGNEKQRLFVQ